MIKKLIQKIQEIRRKNKLECTLWYLDINSCSTQLYTKIISGKAVMDEFHVEPNFVWYTCKNVYVKKDLTLAEIFIKYSSKYSNNGKLSIGDVIEIHNGPMAGIWYADVSGKFEKLVGFFDPE